MRWVLMPFSPLAEAPAQYYPVDGTQPLFFSQWGLLDIICAASARKLKHDATHRRYTARRVNTYPRITTFPAICLHNDDHFEEIIRVVTAMEDNLILEEHM